MSLFLNTKIKNVATAILLGLAVAPLLLMLGGIIRFAIYHVRW
jgi:hypothetical protein